MGPTILLDKSAFESFSRDEHLFLFGSFIRVLPPVLVAEVLADLKKQDSSASTPEELVQRLARKFVGSGPPVHVGHTLLLRGDLIAADVVMDGRSYPESAREVPDQGHGGGLFIDVSPTNEAIMRWGYGQFENHEGMAAEAWRAATIPFPADELKESLASRGVDVPRATSMVHVAENVGAILSNPDLGSCWLDWLLSKAHLNESQRAPVFDRWLRERKTLQQFSPYGYHCMKADLVFIVASASNLIPTRATDLIDVQYLYYTPFCHAFVSNDRLHRALGPVVLRPNQEFVRGEDLKTDLRARHDEASGLDEKARDKRAFAFGMYPVPRPGSIVSSLWFKYCGPWPGRGNSVTSLSPDERRLAIAEATELVRAARVAGPSSAIN